MTRRIQSTPALATRRSDASPTDAAAGFGPLLRRPGTVARIVSAAEKEFAEHGMAGARTDRIARSARVNKALLYYYFTDKNELYLEVVNSLFRGLLDVMDEAFDSNA